MPHPNSEIGAEKLGIYRARPDVFVREQFKVEPDEWQADALRAFPHQPRIAMKACKGPGKTALLAWMAWNFMLTRDEPIAGATSISGDNLKAGLWTELARWRAKSGLLSTTFDMHGRLISHRQYPQTWKLEARTWPKDADKEQIGNALAGIHAPYVAWFCDETGDYPDAVLPNLEGIFSGNPKEAKIVQAGNPRRLSGPLYHACVRARSLWYVVEITGDPDNPKRSPRIPIEHARAQIAQYGRDNPWVKVDIFGEFPPSDFHALIGPEEVQAAMARIIRPEQIEGAPKVIGVDVARYGDDSSIIAKRQGLQIFGLLKYRNINSIQGAGIVLREWNTFDPDAVFIDMTGGWGSGWYDQLITMGKAPIGVGYADDAYQKTRYRNRRAEMAFTFVEWIKRGGALPNDSNLAAALTQTTYVFAGDRFQLEPKDDVKLKLGFSPDEMDACMQTFAEPVQPKARRSIPRREQQPYDPFAEFDRRFAGNTAGQGYDPFANP